MNIKSILLSVLFTTVLIACTGDEHHLENRHKPSGAAEFDYDSNRPFKQYLSYQQNIQKKYNILGRSDKELDNIAPFEMTSDDYSACNKTDRTGILLIHGLTDTPFTIRDIAESIKKNNQCVLLRAITLPGHGTVPGDLLNSKYQQWIKAVNYAIKSFSESGVKDVFLVGLSTGGMMSLDFIDNNYQQSDKLHIKGAVLFSPAVKIKPFGAFMANWHKVISWFLPKAAWLDIKEDKNFAKYESFPKNAAYQVYLLTKKVDYNKKEPFKVPIFIVLSHDDDTIDSLQTLELFNKRSNKKSRLIIYKQGVKNNPCIGKICERSSVYPDLNIKSFSHIAIPVSPENYHYGIKQAYKSCHHYLEDQDKYLKCMSDNNNDFVMGEKSISADKAVRRLTFNPDFEYMSGEINTFILLQRQ